MSVEPVELRRGNPGDPMFDACIDAMDRMREATKHVVIEADDPRDGLTILMTAAAMIAGVHGGTLLAIGALQNQDRRRLGEAALHNFRQGLELGLKKGLQVGAEIGGGQA